MIQPGWHNRTWPLLALVMIIYLWWLALHWAEACAVNEFAKKDSTGCLEFVLNRYQTLISALIALLSALLTIIYLHKQIQHSDDQEKKRIERQEYSARATLPLSLSSYQNYASDCIKVLLQILVLNKTNHRNHQQLQCPSIPREATENLMRIIEHSDLETRKIFADNITVIQIQHSRLEDVCARMSGAAKEAGKLLFDENIFSSIVDSLEVYATQDRLFNYARRSSDQTDTKIDLKNAAFMTNIHNDEYPRVFSIIDNGRRIRDQIAQKLP